MRQRKPMVDEDGLPLDDVEDSALKRRRLGQLCTRSLLTEMTEIFDKQSVKKLERDLRRTQRRNFGNSRVDVAEIYSPPRMAAMASRLGYTPGFSMDLTTLDEDGLPWDLSLAATQRKALRRWELDKPYLLVASPPCTAFCALQNLSRDKREAAEVQAELDAAIQRFAFAAFLC